LALLAAVALALTLLTSLDEFDTGTLFAFLIFMLWITSPALAAAACVAASRTQNGGLLFLGVELLLVLAILGVFVVPVFHDSSAGAEALVTWPLMAWPALLGVIAVAYLCGWRPREGWPDPPAGAAG
jgi:hypothetical protein